MCTITLSFWGAGNQTWGFVPARQTLYQLNYIPSLKCILFVWSVFEVLEIKLRACTCSVSAPPLSYIHQALTQTGLKVAILLLQPPKVLGV